MITAVLIHGFSGSPESWRRMAPMLDAPSYAPAIRGHCRGDGGAEAGAAAATSGSRAAVDACAAFDAEVDRLAAEIGSAVPAPRYVAGYSLGGRLALGLLVRHSDLFAGAALIGANPGIEAQAERAERRKADEAWARRIEEEGLAAFDREWSRFPLFTSQRRLDPEVVAEQRGIRLSHDPAELAAAMTALSLGEMPDYRSALAGIVLPVELVAGGHDPKFKSLARRMALDLPGGAVHVVEGVGHNVPLEAPAELARLLNEAIAGASERRAPVVRPGRAPL